MEIGGFPGARRKRLVVSTESSSPRDGQTRDDGGSEGRPGGGRGWVRVVGVGRRFKGGRTLPGNPSLLAASPPGPPRRRVTNTTAATPGYAAYHREPPPCPRAHLCLFPKRPTLHAASSIIQGLRCSTTVPFFARPPPQPPHPGMPAFFFSSSFHRHRGAAENSSPRDNGSLRRRISRSPARGWTGGLLTIVADEGINARRIPVFPIGYARA